MGFLVEKPTCVKKGPQMEETSEHGPVFCWRP
jgi:hypothetical protein